MAQVPGLPAARLAAIAAAVLLLAFAARAATLGEITVRSAPGEPLQASIAIEPLADERLEPACIFLSHGPAGSGPYLTKARIGIEARGALRVLHILGSEPVSLAGAKLRVVVRCPGEERFAYRQYSALFAPPAAPLAPVSLPGAGAPAAAPALPLLTTGFPVLAGDSLQSIASALFPANPGARDAYVEALRAANPPLAGAGARDALAPGSRLALPDLRALPPTRSRPVAALLREESPRAATAGAPQPPSVRRQPAAAVQLPPGAPPRPAPPAPVTAPSAAAPATAPAPATTARSQPPERASQFVLRLSSPQLDLARSRGMDEKSRARLRDRQLVLDVDDHVAAFLALRDSVKRLEGRVAELQLKLSTLPVPPPAARPEPAPPRVEAAKPPAGPPRAEAVKPPAPAAVAPPPPAPAAKPPAPTPAPTPAPQPAAKPAPPAAPAKVPAKPAPSEAVEIGDWMWAALAAAVAAIGALAWRLLRRRRPPAPGAEKPTQFAATVMLDEEPAPRAPAQAADSGPVDVAGPEPSSPQPVKRREIGSDAGLATEVRAGDPAAVRRRYIEERFPEIANRTIVLDDADSVVKGARLFYEDGSVARAVELLQYATEEKPAEVAPWLALFEIYRLERLSGEYAEAARRFKDTHGKSQSWRKVQYFGRELDADNPLFRDPSMGIDTIRFEAGKPPPGERFDPVAENWLKAPMDFQNEVFATDLRRALLARAGIAEEALAPNPMPALRSVEMFTVA